MGDSYNRNNGNNSNQSNIDKTFYSRLRIKNDNTQMTLNFSFWRGLLKISINNVPRSADEKIEEMGYIHLSPNKAFIFSECVKYVLTHEDSLDIKGVDTGIGETRGMLAIGRDMGKPFLIIAKVGKDGKYEYYTYLKCGKYESDTDHEGPVITLNGDTEQKVSRGSEYIRASQKESKIHSI